MKHKNSVLITGGAGYIGSHIGLILAQQGYAVVVLDNFSQNHIFNPAWATVYNGDYADAELLTKIFVMHKISAVVHCAASTIVSLSVQKPLEYYYNNVSKTITLLQTMRACGVMSLVFSSSCAVYGAPAYIPLDEKHPLSPLSPYGTTKMMVEMLLKDCARAFDLRYVVLRYFNAVGAIPGSGLREWHVPETHIVPLLLHACKVGAPFYVWGNDYPTKDGTCIRDYVHVQDIADAHHKALEHLWQAKPSDVFNIGTGHGWSVKQLVDMAQKITHKECEVIYSQRREGDPSVLVADPRKAMDILEWRPQYSSLEYCFETAWRAECEV